MSITLILLILVAHYTFDWKFQTRNMAENKSKCNKALGRHVLVYFIGLLHVVAFSQLTLGWAVFNAIAHFGVDYCSSRMTSKFYQEENYKPFWDTIGADQLVHYLILFISAAFNLNIPIL
jgi:hypothetical protein